MKKINSGYDTGAKQWAEMCAEGGKIQVKGYARGGAVKKAAPKVAPKAFPKAPPAPTPTSKDTPKMAKGGKWIAGATKNKGALHRALKVPEGEKIPAAKLAKAVNSSNPKLAKQANLAKTLSKFAKGGPVHTDAKQDIKMLKKTVKPDCIKKGKK